MKRRDFLKLSATATVGTVIFQACDFDWDKLGDGSPDREFKIESPNLIPEDYLFGGDAWYASAAPDSAGGPGIIVRVFEGRAKKVEGNPNHPANAGKLGARGQAMVQDLYHPDRISAPMRRTGDRGTGQFEEITWDEALDELVSRLQSVPADQIVALTAPLNGAQRQISDRFFTGIGAERVPYQILDQGTLREALNRVFGSNQLPAINIANSQFMLSFGTDFLHTWISPVQFGQGFGAMRRHSEESPRGYFWHVESRYSGTGAAADRWIPVRPGAEGTLALAIAGVIQDEGIASGNADAFSQVTGGATLPSVEEAAELTGVPAETIQEMARRLATEGPGVVLGGASAGAHTNGLANLTAIYALNLLIDTTDVLTANVFPDDLAELAPDEPVAPDAIRTLVDRMSGGNVGLLLVHDANPVYGLPSNTGIADALGQVETIISFARYIDDTTAHADLILPDSTPLEGWGTVIPTPQPGFPTVGFQQPVVQPFYDTRQFTDVLLSVAEEIGGATLEQLPWTTTQDAVRETAELLRQRGPGNITATDSAAGFWVELLQAGVWANAEEGNQELGQPGGALPDVGAPEFAGNPEEYPFYLVPFEHPSLGAGEHSHLPWMQALPEPITTVVWSSWVELSEETADELGLGFGDYALVTTTGGQAEVRVYVVPAAQADTLAIPMGQGHMFNTRYAEGRGINVLDLVDPIRDAETGALAWAATRAQIEKASGSRSLARMEGVVKAEAPEEYPIVRVTPNPA